MIPLNSDLIQTITGIGTLLTAVAALFTILEMRRQRFEGYRPVIAIDDENVDLYISTQKRPIIVFQPPGQGPASSFSISGITFRLKNVGAGAALAVEARWAFDAIDFASVVARCDPEAGKTISVEDDFVSFDSQGNGMSWMVRKAAQEHHLGTLSASPEKAVDAPLPLAYALFASAYFNAMLSQGSKTAFQSSLPPLTLAVSFRDRTGSEHHTKYRVEFNLFFVATGKPVGDGREWTHIGSGMFTVRAA